MNLKMYRRIRQVLTVGLTSGLPLLFLMLTATSIYLSLLRPALPEWFRSGIATTSFLVLVLPLVPIGIICSLLGSVVSLVYRESRIKSPIALLMVGVDERLNKIDIGYLSGKDQSVHEALNTASAVSSMCTISPLVETEKSR